jgi:nitroreductase
MRVDDAIRLRRTLKAYEPEPVDAATVRELLELAVHAPNHHRTEPWRFVVVGPETLARLAEDVEDPKLRRSRTAVVVAQVVDADAAVAEEDFAACACAIQNLMLGARARGLASFWRTPASLGRPAAHALLGLGPGSRVVGIVHLGRPLDGFPATPCDRSARAVTRVLP